VRWLTPWIGNELDLVRSRGAWPEPDRG